jgi:hypothetical protein
MDINGLRYALSKQVPDMARGFTVATSYGDIAIPPGPMADQLRGHVQCALARELARQEPAPVAVTLHQADGTSTTVPTTQETADALWAMLTVSDGAGA